MWPRGSGEAATDPGLPQQEQAFAPVTVVQALGLGEEEPFFASGNQYARQGFVGSGRAQAYVVASAG